MDELLKNHIKRNLLQFGHQRIFTTNVGSQMWNMERPDSDYDLYSVFVRPTTEILLGCNNKNPKMLKYNIYDLNTLNDASYIAIDEQLMEAGNIIKQLKQSNINALWTIFSPIVILNDLGFLQRFRDITIQNLSKEVYHSTKGLATSNIKRFIEKGDRDSMKFAKKCGIIARTLSWGCDLLREGRIPEFTPMIAGTNEAYLYEWLDALDVALEMSRLPDKAPVPGLFDELLLDLRKWDYEKRKIDKL